jgi:hypothetical protein
MNLLDEIFTKKKTAEDVPRITTEYLKKILDTMQGTLDDQNLEMFESGAWGLLYPRDKQQILNPLSIYSQTDRAGRSGHTTFTKAPYSITNPPRYDLLGPERFSQDRGVDM